MQINRRNFLKQTSVVTAGLATTLATVRPARAKGPNEKVLVGIIGCNGRGKDHIAGYLGLPNAEIAYICDVASRALHNGAALLSSKQPPTPHTAQHFYR